MPMADWDWYLVGKLNAYPLCAQPLQVPQLKEPGLGPGIDPEFKCEGILGDVCDVSCKPGA